jgi:nitrogenase subunit NifH
VVSQAGWETNQLITAAKIICKSIIKFAESLSVQLSNIYANHSKDTESSNPYPQSNPSIFFHNLPQIAHHSRNFSKTAKIMALTTPDTYLLINGTDLS